MDLAFASRLLWLFGMASMTVVGTAAQSASIAPTNSTASHNSSTSLGSPIKFSVSGQAQYPVIPLTDDTTEQLLPLVGLSGQLLTTNAQNFLTIARNDIVLMSCDSYDGFTQPSDVFNQALSADPTAIVLYSNQSSYCSVANYQGSYLYVYSMSSANDAATLLRSVASATSARPLSATIQPVPENPATTNNGTTPQGGSDSSSASNALGPSPTTAVAMIILYSITGIITALFLAIIVTGAVRAHRHPERYGPRNGIGRPRQSRARGLAKAMLDTLPIVRFGEREERNKSTDVELADGTRAVGDILPSRNAQQHDQITTASNTITHADGTHAEDTGKVSLGEGGIAAAEVQEAGAAEQDKQGCSICTDDFEIGQDQRVLPCDHRFHPACIDPWLLNVSGTCPLCRIDLRPQDRTSVDSESDATGDDLAPPLALEGGNRSRRLSMRHSVIFNLVGTNRPNSMTREQRLVALRELRMRRRAEQRTTEEESNIRSRLRNAFHIRTRRTGADGQAQEEAETGDPPRLSSPS